MFFHVSSRVHSGRPSFRAPNSYPERPDGQNRGHCENMSKIGCSRVTMAYPFPPYLPVFGPDFRHRCQSRFAQKSDEVEQEGEKLSV
jgi:hypothetical protein